MDNKKIEINISELKNVNSNRIQKYRRNIRKYNDTPGINIDNLKTNGSAVGYVYNDVNTFSDGTTLTPPSINIIKSIIDTLTSKIAQSKVRPFFNTMNGSYKDMQVALQSQSFFDIYFEEQNVHMTVSKAFEDACVYDTGVIYINEETRCISKALPWQVYVRPAELAYNKITRVFYEQTDYPVCCIPDKITELFKNKNVEYTDFGIYYDIYNKVKAYTINGKVVLKENFDNDTIPFVFIYYNKPVVGTTSLSVVDLLYNIQNQINMVCAKISAAAELTPGNTIFLPEGGSIKATSINNGVGNVMTYRTTPNMTSSPISVATPAFIDTQYQVLLNDLINKAYELIGISQLSAMSKKPTGLDSGVALSTLENIESDRFETQLKQVINSYIDITKKCISLFNDDDLILPYNSRILSLKWSDIKKATSNMKIQYSAADALSKDPSVKLQQLQTLASSGIIPQNRIASLMELPDIQTGYNLSNNAVNAVYSVINDCIEKDVYDIPSYIPFSLLKEEIINVQLSLKAANKKENENDINKLDKLYSIVEDMESEYQKTAELIAKEEAANEQDKSVNILESEASLKHADMDMLTDDNKMGGWT